MVVVVVVVNVVWICFDLLKQQWWVDVAAAADVVGVVAWVCRIVSTIVVLLLPHPT